VSDADNELRALRAEQRAHRNTVRGILGTALMAALAIITNLVNVLRADADKAHISGGAVQLDADIARLQGAVDSLSTRITKLEGLPERMARLETQVEERLPKKQEVKR
jgi:hypothetical protein